MQASPLSWKIYSILLPPATPSQPLLSDLICYFTASNCFPAEQPIVSKQWGLQDHIFCSLDFGAELTHEWTYKISLQCLLFLLSCFLMYAEIVEKRNPNIIGGGQIYFVVSKCFWWWPNMFGVSVSQIYLLFQPNYLGLIVKYVQCQPNIFGGG